MIVTVTGTRAGWTPQQRQAFIDWMDDHHGVDIVIHGAAHGVDTQVHTEVARTSLSIEVHPASGVPSNVDHLTTPKGVYVIRKARPPLDRNKVMVNAGDVLIGFPRTMSEELRSGTWAAIRYGLKVNKHVIIIWPDGALEEYERIN